MKQVEDIIDTVICADCMDILPQLPDNCVDLVLTDPPYGIGIDGQKEDIRNGVQIRKGHEFKGWDSQIPPKECFEQLFRISKNQVIFGANYFTQYLPAGHKGWIVWYKGQKGLTMSDCEIIFTSFDCPTRIFDLHRTHLWQESPQHPTQKPTKLIRYIVENHSKEGDIICDPFLGSGTSATVAWDLRRHYIGIEISPEYCEIARKRIQQEKDKYGLFND